MGVAVTMPKAQETSIGRRLFAVGAPIVGGAFGGPAGAAAGSVLGSKVGGASNQEALMGGLQSAISRGITKGGATSAAPQGLDQSQKLAMPALGDSAFSRRLSASSQSPKIAIKEGLDALTGLPPELREMYTPALVQAELALEKPQLGGSYARRR